MTAWEQYVYVPIDPNAADAATLEQVPGVDAAIAEALIAARPFESDDDFLATLSELVGKDAAATAQSFLVTP